MQNFVNSRAWPNHIIAQQWTKQEAIKNSSNAAAKLLILRQKFEKLIENGQSISLTGPHTLWSIINF